MKNFNTLNTLRLWAQLVGKVGTSEDIKNNYFLQAIDGKVVLITGNKKTGKMFGEEINDNNIDLFKDQNFFLKAIINIK